MARVTVFSYRPGKSHLHRLDPRCKLLMLLIINLQTFNASLPVLAVLSLGVSALFIWQKIPLRATVVQTRLFFLLLLFVLLTRSLSIAGDPLLSLSGLVVSYQGVVSGLIYCWKMTLVLISGILFITSSQTTEIQGAIRWFLKPVPLIPEKRVATMIGLMIRFLPLILEQGKEISEAQKARGVEQIKNPARRLYLYSIPLIRGVFNTADTLITAMEARCYTEDRTDAELSCERKDLIITTLFLLSMIVLLIFLC